MHDQDVAEIIRSACHSRSVIKLAPPRAGDIRHSGADVSTAAAVLNFRPRFSIEAGLPDTVAWFAADAVSSRTDGGRAFPRFSGESTPGDAQCSITPA